MALLILSLVLSASAVDVAAPLARAQALIAAWEAGSWHDLRAITVLLVLMLLTMSFDRRRRMVVDPLQARERTIRP